MTTKFQINYPDITKTATIDISVDNNTSNVVDLEHMPLAGIYIPSNFDGTQFKVLTAPTEDGTYVEVQISGEDYTVTTAASKYVAINDLGITAGLRFIKIETVTNQSGDDTVFTIVRRQIQ